MTRRFLVLALFALLSFHQTMQAQILPRAIVKGRVLDDSTRAPIPLANVFISNSTIGTATNAVPLHLLAVGAAVDGDKIRVTVFTT